ncbi:MAG: hypothetical protein ACRYG8_40875 [Janthinobacterium lividum]
MTLGGIALRSLCLACRAGQDSHDAVLDEDRLLQKALVLRRDLPEFEAQSLCGRSVLSLNSGIMLHGQRVQGSQGSAFLGNETSDKPEILGRKGCILCAENGCQSNDGILQMLFQRCVSCIFNIC